MFVKPRTYKAFQSVLSSLSHSIRLYSRQWMQLCYQILGINGKEIPDSVIIDPINISHEGPLSPRSFGHSLVSEGCSPAPWVHGQRGPRLWGQVQTKLKNSKWKRHWVSLFRGFFFLGALARARCRSTCAAVAYAATTSCTALFVTAPCNVRMRISSTSIIMVFLYKVMFPVSAAAAAGR